MSGSKWLWVGGGVLSLLAHATAAAILTMAPAQEEEPAMIAGGVVAEVAMLGSNAFDAMESGKIDDVIKPETVEPDVTEPQPQEVTEIQPTEIQPETTEIVSPTDPVVSEPVQELIIPSAEVEIAAVPVPEIKPEIEPEEEIKPVPEVKKEKPVKKVERKKPKERPVRKAGDDGKSAQSLKKGSIDGSDEAKTEAVGGQKKGNSSVAGDAAVSNYKGKVRNKINRAKRRVKGGDRGTVVVSFTVGAGGQASGIRVARSSGSAALDQAALESVQRASPFPKIPESAGRSSWPFNVPIVFK
ncbi:energy transducer TonB [Shinella curvata]|uniref:Energy transducer TonB n=1 Tax=Shinella curvata TaxID=1817964 RepID=A0ABT8XJI7_9HYPH|nr:energy transducer TonB [Shinella curvata]MCJ8052815.1 energy transducer TonB [Shinella curvata]MDO6123895.1 energy transducer TonB [Shinella curvata]